MERKINNDDIATGSKLTKADAGRVFPNTGIGGTKFAQAIIAGFYLKGPVTFTLTGANADQFQIAENASIPVYASSFTRAIDQYGNLLPIATLISFTPTTIGTKTAQITITCPASAKTLTYDLTGVAVVPFILVDPNPIPFGTAEGPPPYTLACTIEASGSSDPLDIAFSGPDYAEFDMSFDGGNTWLTANEIAPNIYNEVPQTDFMIRWQPFGSGAKTANFDCNQAVSPTLSVPITASNP